MKLKSIITVVLLLFVAASVAYLVVGNRGEQPETETNSAGATPTDPAPSNPAGIPGIPGTAPDTAMPSDVPGSTLPPDDPAPAPATTSPERYVNVYYFHGFYRCITCRTIEMYTREAVNEAFLTELGDGSLHMQVLNMQEPANEAYVNDFKLEYYVVVLEKIVDGKRVEWKKLERVWDLLNDKDAFKKYVISETRNYLKGIN